MLRNLLRLAVYTALFLVAAAGGFLVWAYRASQRPPEFYQQALVARPEVQKEAAQALERNVEQLKSEVLQEDRWEACFSDEQINGWLAAELPQRYPYALPRQVHDPRVAIEPQQAWLGCQYKAADFSTIVTIAAEIEMGGEPNELAVRILRARAGALPLPWKKWSQRITFYARRANVRIRWEEKEDELVAWVTLPLDQPEFKNRKLLLDTVELREGAVFLSGSSTDRAISEEPLPRTRRTLPPLALSDQGRPVAGEKQTRHR